MKKRAPFNMVLLGDVAAGKAAQSARIAKKYRMFDFDMGRELRRIRANPALRRKHRLTETLDAGKLTPTALVRAIDRETIARIPASTGILFDGHPKMLGEAKIVERELRRAGRTDPFVVYLSVPLAETVKRMTKRGRPEDNPRSLRERARYYRKNVSAVMAFFRKRYRFATVSGVGTREEVFRRIKKHIDRMHVAEDA